MNIKKIGHAGTLDPAATGLLVIGVGAGTKELNQYIKLDKEYEAEILIGESRTTGDMDGEVVESVEVAGLTEEKVKQAVSELIGAIELPVSAYSAIKKDGVPFYKKAFAAEKRGETIRKEDLPIREMKIHKAELLKTHLCIINDTQKMVAEVRFEVGSGTYIRSLAEELGRKLGYPAVLKNLRRTKVGEFRIEEAVKLEDL